MDAHAQQTVSPLSALMGAKMKKLKLMTVVGTRPEIIKMSAIIKKCDRYFNHVLVHTGQNYDYALSQVFFQELGL